MVKWKGAEGKRSKGFWAKESGCQNRHFSSLRETKRDLLQLLLGGLHPW